jgi:hypothetical protein
VAKNIAEAKAVNPARLKFGFNLGPSSDVGVRFTNLSTWPAFMIRHICVNGPIAREASALAADLVPVRGRV